MQKPIIPIKRASEDVVLGLVEMGILEVTSNGIRCKENSPAHQPTKANVQD